MIFGMNVMNKFINFNTYNLPTDHVNKDHVIGLEGELIPLVSGKTFEPHSHRETLQNLVVFRNRPNLSKAVPYTVDFQLCLLKNDT